MLRITMTAIAVLSLCAFTACPVAAHAEEKKAPAKKEQKKAETPKSKVQTTAAVRGVTFPIPAIRMDATAEDTEQVIRQAAPNCAKRIERMIANNGKMSEVIDGLPLNRRSCLIGGLMLLCYGKDIQLFAQAGLDATSDYKDMTTTAQRFVATACKGLKMTADELAIMTVALEQLPDTASADEK